MHRTLQNRDIILKHLQAIEYDDNHSYASGFYCGDDEVVIDDIFGKVSPEELLSEYQIDQSNFSDNVKAYFINSDLRLLVLEECDLLVLTDDTQSEIYAVTDGLHFVVDDLHRGKGYGKFLVKATLLMDGNLKNWDSDKIGYSNAGYEMTNSACLDYQIRLERRGKALETVLKQGL